MNKYLSGDEWIPVDGIYYGDQSTEYEIIKGERNYLVTAGPGAGKTELLAQKASYLLQVGKCSSPRKILALSVKVDAKDNIKDRVEKRCGKELSSRFISKTYDSFFKGLLDQFIYLLPDEYRPSLNYNMIESGKIDEYYKKVIDGWIYLKRYRKDFYRMKYLVENPLPIIETQYGDIARRIWPMMLKGECGLEAQINFPMIVRLVQLLVNNNTVIKEMLQLTYEYIFLDEFQDTTEVQYDVIRDIFRGSRSILTAVGDNKQRIMKWAGAKESIFEIFKNDFNAQEKILLINHRSAPNLLKLQSVVAQEITGKEMNFEADKKWEKDSGFVQLYTFENEDEEAKLVSESIRSLISTGINARDICILVRQKPGDYCNKIVELLKGYKIQSRYEDLYQSLAREKVVKLIIDILKISINQQSPEEYVSVLNILNKKSEKVNMDSLHTTFREVKSKITNVSNENDLHSAIEYIVNYIGRDFIKSYYPEYNRGNYLDKQIGRFTSLIYESYKSKNDWSLAISDFAGGDTIPIMSVHKSKGLEFNAIFFIGIDEKIFWNYNNNKEEELCSFFVGISRAKENLYITSTKNRSSFDCETKIISDFELMISEAAITIAND